ncbi:hypothetical protein DPEC_G00301640 [Dallia pectoralis]|uniref:Uncharacterized protein n=1 Tax=Dallia pectoralis TaxID=75939 RepID=A0ACC2FGW9_DALPE|nr:hypothetical protein DPEC_G00301640 [Dallia pectoralis]
MTNCDTLNGIAPEHGEETLEDEIYAVVFGSVVAVGLPLNAVSLWILVCRHRLKSSSSVFMSHLALSDLLLVLSLPARVYFHARGNWTLSDYACLSVTMLFRNNIRASVCFITCISLDRLLAVVYPLRSRHLRTTANAWKACAVTWTAIVIFNIPESLYHMKKLETSNATGTCFAFRQCSDEFSGYIIAGIIFALLGVNMVSTAMVARTLHSRLSHVAMVKNKISVMMIFAMNLLMFIVFFVPLSIFLLLRINPYPMICLASVNCCLDPLLYYFSFDAFWKKKDGSDVEVTLARSHVIQRESRTL